MKKIKVEYDYKEISSPDIDVIKEIRIGEKVVSPIAVKGVESISPNRLFSNVTSARAIVLAYLFEDEINNLLPYPMMIFDNRGTNVVATEREEDEFLSYDYVDMTGVNCGRSQPTYKIFELTGDLMTDVYHIINPPVRIDYIYPKFRADILYLGNQAFALLDVEFIKPY